MKKRIQDFSEVTILRRNTKLKTGCLYMLTSEAVAKNIYFESKREISFAHRQIRKHLSGIMDIVDYLFTPYGWVLIVRIKEIGKILDFCKKKIKLSQTIKSAIRDKDISVIVSQYIRYAISTIGLYINRNCGRQGSVVRENFSRYIFDDIGSAHEIMRKMKKDEIDLCRQRRRYRPNLRLWDTKNELLGMHGVFLTTRKMIEELRIGEIELVVIEVVAVANYVLQELISRTKSRHLNHISTKSAIKSIPKSPN